MTAIGFDGNAYITLQRDAILERMSHFQHRLYLEVGGKFLYDGHASRVLPGFDPTSKEKIFHALFDSMDIIFCVNYDDILENRMLGADTTSYTDTVLSMLMDISEKLGKQPYIAVNKCPRQLADGTSSLDSSVIAQLDRLRAAGYAVYHRYKIPWYPQDTTAVLRATGYGHDDYIPTTAKLVLVTGAASNSGKMSTCLGQIYHEHMAGHDAGYAKYETFPIRNLPLHHPINLAYEAATADIGDYNMIDTFHRAAYGIDSVNYNRDVDAFVIVKQLADAFLPADNFTRTYKSPTDMGINKAGFAITDDAVCRAASWKEIERRRDIYALQVAEGVVDAKAVERCEELLQKKV